MLGIGLHYFIYLLDKTCCAMMNEEILFLLRKVGPMTTPTTTHCMCNHLTWLASSFFIPPNKLDVKSEILKLKQLDDYPALLVTFCVLMGVSLICMIWARRKDSHDVQKVRVLFFIVFL